MRKFIAVLVFAAVMAAGLAVFLFLTPRLMGTGVPGIASGAVAFWAALWANNIMKRLE